MFYGQEYGLVRKIRRLILTHTNTVTGFISQLHEESQHKNGSTNCDIRQEEAFKIFAFQSAIGSNHTQILLSLALCSFLNMSSFENPRYQSIFSACTEYYRIVA